MGLHATEGICFGFFTELTPLLFPLYGSSHFQEVI